MNYWNTEHQCSGDLITNMTEIATGIKDHSGAQLSEYDRCSDGIIEEVQISLPIPLP